MASKSFQVYQGQYHISPVMAQKASAIYTNWLNRAFQDPKEKVFIAEYNNIPVGFFTANDLGNVLDVALAGVSNKYRSLGAYRNMGKGIAEYARDHGKLFFSGTSFENLTVQRAWLHIGLRPYSSFYNFHLDAR